MLADWLYGEFHCWRRCAWWQGYIALGMINWRWRRWRHVSQAAGGRFFFFAVSGVCCFILVYNYLPKPHLNIGNDWVVYRRYLHKVRLIRNWDPVSSTSAIISFCCCNPFLHGFVSQEGKPKFTSKKRTTYSLRILSSLPSTAARLKWIQIYFERLRQFVPTFAFDIWISSGALHYTCVARTFVRGR